MLAWMFRRIAIAAFAFGLLAGPALADVTVIGNGLAADCSTAARSVAANGPARSEGVRQCTLALENEVLSPHETAATYVNRGVLHLAAREFGKALADFDSALRIEPQLAEALTNRGAALIGQGHDAEGIAEINRGLALSPMEPEKAYFNRAIAEERLGDLKSAYADYRKAQALKPDWPLPAAELARFRVSGG
jgi:tetratricopeptide (TPR) repeat protein